MLLDVAVTVSTCVSPPPAAIPVRLTVCALASSRIAAGFVIASRVGAAFTTVTVATAVIAFTESVAVMVRTPVERSVTPENVPTPLTSAMLPGRVELLSELVSSTVPV